jgi:succinate dehydrogenase / fumarate reductase cytochrome b subunit
VAVAVPSRPSTKVKAGRIYRGRTGMWTFILHRVTGLAILGFLLLHIVGESFMGVSQAAFDTVEDIYKNFFFRLSEVGLLFALLFHALNGLRITAIDFFPKLARRQKMLTAIEGVIFVALYVPAAIIMFYHYFHKG